MDETIIAPAPAGWDEALWLALAPEARDKVGALSAEHLALCRACREHEQYRAAMDGELRRALDVMSRVVECDCSGTDWDALARRDPGLWVRMRQQRDARRNAVSALEQRWQARRAAEEARRAAEDRRLLSAEADAFRAEFRELMGEERDHETCKAELYGYLLEQGVPAEVLGRISRAYELRMAVKALLFDRMKDCRASAAAKMALAPAVSVPGPSPVEGGSVHKARARLNLNPNSTEALAALFASI